MYNMNFQNLKTPISDIDKLPNEGDAKHIILRITYNDTSLEEEKYDEIKLTVLNNPLLNYILEDKKEQIKSLIYNKIGFKKYFMNSKENVDELISRYFFKKSPNEIMDNVLAYLYSISDSGSLECNIDTRVFNSREVWRKFYFLNSEEFKFYMKALDSLGYFNYKSTADSWYGSITIQGFNRLYELDLKKNDSNICFVAMAFNDEMFDVYRQAIEPAIRATGFIPEIVSDLQIESDTTINDKIIAGIKKAQFTISDFSYHKNGVYFEAGMALGRGQKVIYTCKESEITSTHFDVRNYQILVWKDAEDFKVKLIDKIEAFIKD